MNERNWENEGTCTWMNDVMEEDICGIIVVEVTYLPQICPNSLNWPIQRIAGLNLAGKLGQEKDCGVKRNKANWAEYGVWWGNRRGGKE